MFDAGGALEYRRMLTPYKGSTSNTPSHPLPLSLTCILHNKPTHIPLIHMRRMIYHLVTALSGVRYHVSAFSDNPPLTAKEAFNWRHASKRTRVEQAIGHLKQRWKILTKGMYCSIERASQYVRVCVGLHNLLGPPPDDTAEEEDQDDGEQNDAQPSSSAMQWRDAIAADCFAYWCS